MGLMKDRKLEDEYAKILEDMGLELPDNIILEDDKPKEEKKEKNEE